MFGKTEKQVLTVEGMTCGHCEQRVEKALERLEGVKKVQASHKAHTVEIVSKKDRMPDADTLRRVITGLGYQVR